MDEMNLQQIIERLAALEVEVREATDIEIVNAGIEEKKNLLTRKVELEALEARKQTAKDLNEGKIEGRKFDFINNQEDKKMEVRYDSASKEYRNAYLKNLKGNELTVEERAAITAVTVVPTATVNRIIEKLEQTSAIYNRITVTGFPNKLSFPVEGTKNDAAWVAMATASTDGVDTFGEVSLTAFKLIKTIEINADTEAMSIDAFESFIVNQLVKKMNKAVENAVLNGTGTNQPTGLLKAGEITEVGTFTKAAMKYKDLTTLLSKLPTPYHNDAVIVMPRALFFGEVLGMETTTGEPVAVADVQSPAKFNVLGYPVIINDFMPTDTILFGDLSYYYYNWAKQIEISKDASVGFRTGSTVYRALALADGKKALAEAFVVYTRALA